MADRGLFDPGNFDLDDQMNDTFSNYAMLLDHEPLRQLLLTQGSWLEKNVARLGGEHVALRQHDNGCQD